MELRRVHSVVDGHDSGAGSLQEIGVRGFKEAVICRRLVELLIPALRQRLRQDTKDGLIGLRANVMPSINQDWLTHVAAQMPRSVAT